MKRLLYLVMVTLVALLILVPTAMAQEMEAEVKIEETAMMESTGPLPASGGQTLASPSVLLPAGALLLGSGVLAFSVLRRR